MIYFSTEMIYSALVIKLYNFSHNFCFFGYRIMYFFFRLCRYSKIEIPCDLSHSVLNFHIHNFLLVKPQDAGVLVRAKSYKSQRKNEEPWKLQVRKLFPSKFFLQMVLFFTLVHYSYSLSYRWVASKSDNSNWGSKWVGWKSSDRVRRSWRCTNWKGTFKWRKWLFEPFVWNRANTQGNSR